MARPVPGGSPGGDDIPDPHIVAPGTAPTPFSAAEIREGCPPGRTVTFRVVEKGVARLETTLFVSCDEEGAVMEKSVLGETGAPLSEPEVRSARWAELQGHAAFPADRTTISRETVGTEVGVFECLHYTVAGAAGDADFWFAVDLPGMPIKARAPGWQMDLRDNIG